MFKSKTPVQPKPTAKSSTQAQPLTQSSLNEFMQAMRAEMQAMHAEMQVMRAEIETLQTKVATQEAEINEQKENQAQLEAELFQLKASSNITNVSMEHLADDEMNLTLKDHLKKMLKDFPQSLPEGRGFRALLERLQNDFIKLNSLQLQLDSSSSGEWLIEDKKALDMILDYYLYLYEKMLVIQAKLAYSIIIQLLNFNSEIPADNQNKAYDVIGYAYALATNKSSDAYNTIKPIFINLNEKENETFSFLSNSLFSQAHQYYSQDANLSNKLTKLNALYNIINKYQVEIDAIDRFHYETLARTDNKRAENINALYHGLVNDKASAALIEAREHIQLELPETEQLISDNNFNKKMRAGIKQTKDEIKFFIHELKIPAGNTIADGFFSFLSFIPLVGTLGSKALKKANAVGLKEDRKNAISAQPVYEEALDKIFIMLTTPIFNLNENTTGAIGARISNANNENRLLILADKITSYMKEFFINSNQLTSKLVTFQESLISKGFNPPPLQDLIRYLFLFSMLHDKTFAHITINSPKGVLRAPEISTEGPISCKFNFELDTMYGQWKEVFLPQNQPNITPRR